MTRTRQIDFTRTRQWVRFLTRKEQPSLPTYLPEIWDLKIFSEESLGLYVR